MITLVISDIHLGSRNSRADLVSQLLTTEFDRLVLNGDTVNSLNFKKLRPDHWKVLGELREVARQRELILIRGNHDGKADDGDGYGSLDMLASVLGAELQEEYYFTWQDRRYLILHGDCFDPTLHWPLLTDAAEWCYQTVQKINKKGAKWLKHRVKKLGGVVEFVKQRAVRHAQGQNCQGVITGHTHFCDDEWIDNVHYLNSGCWVDQACTFIRIDEEAVRLCHWQDGLHLTKQAEEKVLCRA